MLPARMAGLPGNLFQNSLCQKLLLVEKSILLPQFLAEALVEECILLPLHLAGDNLLLVEECNRLVGCSLMAEHNPLTVVLADYNLVEVAGNNFVAVHNPVGTESLVVAPMAFPGMPFH